MTVGEHFAALCDMLGIDKQGDGVKDLVTLTTNMPPDFEGKYKAANVLTFDQARNHAGLKGHFTKNALDAIDKDHEAAYLEHGFDDATIAEFKKESSTYKRQTALRKKIAELESAKMKSTGDDKDKLVKKINELNKQVTDTEEKYKSEIAALKKNEDARMLDYALRSHLASRKYPGDKIPHDVNVQTAYYLLEKALKEKNGLVKFADANKGAIKLVPADNPDLDYTVNNKTLTFESFVEQTLADNGLTIVSKPATNGNGSHTVDLNALPENDRGTAKQLLEHVSQM